MKLRGWWGGKLPSWDHLWTWGEAEQWGELVGAAAHQASRGQWGKVGGFCWGEGTSEHRAKLSALLQAAPVGRWSVRTDRELKQAVSENGATKNCIGCTKDLGAVFRFVFFFYLPGLWLMSLIVLININYFLWLGFWKFSGVVAAE